MTTDTVAEALSLNPDQGLDASLSVAFPDDSCLV